MGNLNDGYVVESRLWKTLAACCVVALAIGSVAPRASGAIFLRVGTGTKCQLPEKNRDTWEETNGTSGLQKTGTNPDTQLENDFKTYNDCVNNCDPTPPLCEKITEYVPTPDPNDDPNNKDEFRYCSCDGNKPAWCHGIMKDPFGSAPPEYHCEGNCSAAVCDDSKKVTSDPVVTQNGNYYFEDTITKCDCSY